MQRIRRTIVWQGVAVCALWACGLALLQFPARGLTSQDTQSTKSSKAKKAKKSASDATSSVTTPSAPATPAKAAPATTTAKSSKAPAPVSNASDADIQAAKGSGKVWVNTETGVYHKSGQWYGTTKKGKFMAEQEATKAGYKAAKNEK